MDRIPQLGTRDLALVSRAIELCAGWPLDGHLHLLAHASCGSATGVLHEKVACEGLGRFGRVGLANYLDPCSFPHHDKLNELCYCLVYG